MATILRVKMLGTIVWEGYDAQERTHVVDAIDTVLKVTGAKQGKIRYGQSYSENGKMYDDIAWARFE